MRKASQGLQGLISLSAGLLACYRLRDRLLHGFVTSKRRAFRGKVREAIQRAMDAKKKGHRYVRAGDPRSYPTPITRTPSQQLLPLLLPEAIG